MCFPSGRTWWLADPSMFPCDWGLAGVLPGGLVIFDAGRLKLVVSRMKNEFRVGYYGRSVRIVAEVMGE